MIRLKTALVLASLLAALPAMADSVSNETSSASSTSWRDKVGEKVYFTYFGLYRGSRVGDPGNKYQPAIDGSLDTTSTQSMENVLTTGYKINKNWMAGVTTHFYYSPLGMSAAQGQNFEWLDPSLMLSRANVIDTGALKLKAQLFMPLPSSRYDYLKRHGLITALVPTGILSYDVPNTKITLGLYSYITAYIPGANAPDAYRTYKVYSAPNANYQFTKTFAGTMWIDLIQAARMNVPAGTTGRGLLGGLQNTDMDIEPGVNWEFVKDWNFNPQLNIYPKNLTWAATSIQAVVSGKIF